MQILSFVKFRHPLFLSLLSGFLFAVSWPETGSLTFLIFFAFVPLLILEQRIFSNPEKFRSRNLFFYSYISFFIFNVTTSWWILHASLGGAVMAVVFNALFMSVVFQLFHVVKKKLSGRFAPLILLSFWLSFEYLHLRWDLTWPWLCLGNVFAPRPWMIQWYEFTGTFGGALWIFAVNFLVFFYVKKNVFQNLKSIRNYLMPGLVILAFIFLPVIGSFLTCFLRFDFCKKVLYHTVIVQPNIDPYTEKFNGNNKDQLEKMLTLAETKIDSTTYCVIFPETAIQENLWENDLEKTYSIRALRKFQDRHPKMNIVIGATSAYQYEPGESRSATARKFTDIDEYYEDYNTALFLSGKGTVQKYHKSKFVPGVERMPFPALFKPLEKFAISLGGTTGSLCGQDERIVFLSENKELKIAPAICYESVFGEFMTEYIKKGANVIFIITNDGWWGDSPGYRQHIDYARLRAIETRRCIARSANTGISCFIDEWGAVTQATEWWKPLAVKGNIHLEDRLTFYVRHGDYIARAAILLGGLLLIYSLVKRFWKKG